MEDKETGLNPVPLPVISPPHGSGEVETLEGMLNKRSGPVVRYPPLLECFDERHAEEHGGNHDKV